MTVTVFHSGKHVATVTPTGVQVFDTSLEHVIRDAAQTRDNLPFDLAVQRSLGRGAYWRVIPTNGTTATKGGPGSGHFGHRGRPGKRGGSSPSHGQAVFTEGWTVEPELARALLGSDPREAVANAFAVPLYETRFRGRFGPSPPGHAYGWIGGDIATLGDKPEIIGQFSRELTLDALGKHAWNDDFWLKQGYQGRGIGSRMYDQEIATLRDLDFEDIGLGAAGTVGRYAWARKGFDFQEEGRLDEGVADLLTWLSVNGALPLVDQARVTSIQSAPDMATFVVPRWTDLRQSDIPTFENDDVPRDLRMGTGKAFMLDTSLNGHRPWRGILRLKEAILKHIGPEETQKAVPVPSDERLYIEARWVGFDDSWFHSEYLQEEG